MMRTHITSPVFSILISFLFSLSTFAQPTYDIRLNQIGFLPNAGKHAAVINSDGGSFTIKTADLSTTLFTGDLSSASYFTSADEEVRIADFTSFNQPGEYVLHIEGLGQSVPFTIGNGVFNPVTKALTKGFYFNRASTELLAEHAGKWARAAGHPDTSVVVHPSGASAERPAGTIISTPYGWYDAGDYNKYMVNSGISTYTLLSAYETYPEYFDTLSLNIPESDNNIPDILDEAMWNIKWMMTMQDPNDGGVYNKTTTASFEHQVTPEKAIMTRYVITKTTAAALDFAAIMAVTSRIYKPYLPELSDQVLEMAKSALAWAEAHPNIAFSKPEASGDYPRVSTGSYGDAFFEDEFAWCNAELYITTKDDQYYTGIDLNNESYDIPNSGSVRTLGLLSLLNHKHNLTALADTTLAKQKLLQLIKPTRNNTIATPYRIPGEFFGWGGNAIYGNRGMLLLQAYNITRDPTYFNAAVSTLDYLLGRNATTYCFVTGLGSKSPRRIHHRISNSDGIADPIPGLMAGGPNPGDVDTDCGASAYPSLLPAKAYLDQSCSYTTNEIAINWSAPAVFLAGGIQATYAGEFREDLGPYLMASVNTVNLPVNTGSEATFVLASNTSWTLSSNVSWINFSKNTGSGEANITVTSTSDNPGQDSRQGYIYLLSNDQILDSIVVSQNGVRKNFLIQAEDFAKMFGLQKENTIDLGGGENIGYVDVGDWVEYDIDISFEGDYEVTIRHAGLAGGFDVLVDGHKFQTASVPSTGDWQNWASNKFELPLPEGAHTLKFLFNAQGINVNWYQFDWLRDAEVVIPEDTTDTTEPIDTTSILNTRNEDVLLLYPVPAKDHVTLISNGEVVKSAKIYAMDGREVVNQKLIDTKSPLINLNTLRPGIYMMKVTLANGQTRTLRLPVE